MRDDAGNPDQWERAELRRAKPASATLSFRLPAGLAVAIDEFASAQELSVSDVLRQAVEEFMGSRQGIQAPVFYYFVSGTTSDTYLRTGGPTTMEPWATRSAGSTTISLSRLPLFEATA